MQNNYPVWKNHMDFKPINSDPCHSPTLPGFYYHDQAVFDAEKENIFYKTWQLVAHTSQLKSVGSYVTAQIADQNVFVIRSQDSQIKGFYNVCQHRAHELLEGSGCIKSRIVCPYHNWSYDFSGKLKSVRYCNQPCFDLADHSLSPIQTAEMLGFVFVNLDPSASSLEDLPGNLFDDIKENVPGWRDLVVSSEIDSSHYPRARLHTNWKVLSENSLENYHVEVVHPAYAKMVDIHTYEWNMSGYWIKGSGKIKSLEEGAYTITESESSQMAITWRLWPNTAFFLLPGEQSFSAVVYHPAKTDLTLRTNITLMHPSQVLKSDRWNYLWSTIWEEDASICESVQRGLQSRGYRQGRFMINPDKPSVSEYGPHLFQLNYAHAMGLESE